MSATTLAGRLLVASPALADPNFARTVVLVLEHGEEGALGVVVNRPTSVPVGEVLPSWRPVVGAPGVLFAGGPVSVDSALGLVALAGGPDSDPVGVKRLHGDLGLIDLDVPPEVAGPGLASLRIYAGYAGWSAGQLEGEVREGAWYIVDAEPGDPFRPDASDLWRVVLRRQRGSLAFLANYPPDPSLN